MKLQDILDRQTAVRAELLEIEKKEDRTDEDEAYTDTLLTEWDELEEQRKPLAARMERLDAVRYAAKDERKVEKTTPDLVVSRDMDPFQDLDAVRSKMIHRADMIARAQTAIERCNRVGQMNSDFAEAATVKVQQDPGIARHLLLTGSDEYQKAFQAYVEDPEGQASRAALSLTLANGGYMLPFVLDPTIVLTNSASANPWRRISNIKQTTSNTWNGVTSAGVNAAWLAEATIVTDNTPTVGNIQITPQKAAAWVFGSYEVLADTDFANQLPVLLGDAKDRLEEAAFATGPGTTTPTGIITGATTVYTTATTLVYALADVYGIQAALPARFRTSPSVAWAMNVAYINRTRQFDTAGGASFWTNLGKGQPETLLGAPIYESTTMFGGAPAVGSLMAVFGDFSNYYIVDRVGVSLMYEPMVKGTGGILPNGQAGWYMFWRVGAGVSTPNAFRVLKGA
jgi:HK97 family phage major capsid protein